MPAPQSESDHCQQPLHLSPSRPTYHHPLHPSYGGEKKENVCIVFPNVLFTALNLRFLVPNTRETDKTRTRYNICRLRNCSYHHYLERFIVPTYLWYFHEVHEDARYESAKCDANCNVGTFFWRGKKHSSYCNLVLNKCNCFQAVHT